MKKSSNTEHKDTDVMYKEFKHNIHTKNTINSKIIIIKIKKIKNLDTLSII